MTYTCPEGHESGDPLYCDVCGILIAPTPAPPGPQPTEMLPVVEEADTSAAAPQEPCPVCDTPRSGDDRFCEKCGHDFDQPPDVRAPSSEAEWEAVASADRGQFERFAPPGLVFPSNAGEQRFALDGPQMRIGRSRSPTGEPSLEIDLAGPSEDPGISRLHAVLERQDDGSYAVRDLGSTNGTLLNDSRAVGTAVAVPLAAGDKIRVGAWTTITLRAR